ncbi:RHS repeat domain-containing protein [Clostridium hydrogenum]|uniref:RHS repeat domain-containing protein n=1 Tax=Clostridium hydrogenum TaxID=2855764 RepID=UPI001F404784|nr:hypothetical protein [Clostridium hydrogenum]
MMFLVQITIFGVIKELLTRDATNIVLNKIVATTDALGNETRNKYYKLDRLKGIADVAGNSTRFTYDNMDRL